MNNRVGRDINHTPAQTREPIRIGDGFLWSLVGVVIVAASVVGVKDRIHDERHAKAVHDALPYCVVPAGLGGISQAESRINVSPEGATVRIVHSDGTVVDPNKDPKTQFGNILLPTDSIAVAHVGATICQAAGGESTPTLQNLTRA